MRDPTSVEATGWTSSGYSKPPSSAPWPTTLTWFPAFVLPGVGAEKVLVVQAARVGRMIQLHTVRCTSEVAVRVVSQVVLRPNETSPRQPVLATVSAWRASGRLLL